MAGTNIILNCDDARRLARRRLPRMFFDYIDGGSFGETTLRSNRDDFARWTLRQKALTGATGADLSTHFAGRRQALPFMLGPIGFLGLFHGRGELAAARAAAQADIPFALSNFAISTIESIRRASAGSLHMQLYVLRDRALAEDVMARARAAGADMLHLTVDTAITAVREKDDRNGFRSAMRFGPGLLMRLATRPRRCLDMARSGRMGVGVAQARPQFGKGVLAQAANLSRLIDPGVCWADVDWVRRTWPGKLSLKGILDPQDALRAAEAGADAIVVSNHGGRQLDGAPSTISVLPEIVDAIDGRIDVLIDGGFRRGQDIIKAIALGASGVLLGRAYAFALAAAGGEGVQRMIGLLSDEVRISLALMGLDSIDALKQAGRQALRSAPVQPC